jgi:cell division protein FtsW
MAADTALPRLLPDEDVQAPRGPADWRYTRLVLIAASIGIVFVFSATFFDGGRNLGAAGLHHLKRQALFLVVGLVVMVLASYVRPQRWVRSPWLLGVFALGLVAMLLCRWGPLADPAGGSHCWLRLPGGNKLQPSEFTKVLHVLILAGILSQAAETRRARRRMLTGTLLMLALMCGALAIQEDLGMALLVVSVTLAMLFARGVSLPLLTGLALLLASGGVLVAMRSPVRWQRILIFLHPESDAGDTGYQLCQMRATLARGGVGGLGLGLCPEKWSALPASHTDSIFCIIGGELGLLGAAGVIVLFWALTARALKLAQQSSSPALWHTGVGIGILMGIQALIHLGVATVSIPCTGLTLPFISAGGSSLVASMASAGIVLAVSRFPAQPPGEGTGSP